MKIRNLLIASTLALAFIFAVSPVVTHAQTIADLQAKFQALFS
ncbi:MAG: hypothetical protein AAB415_01570 [Patescibacteria group bacterium]